MKDKLYCCICKEYTEHENDLCSICGDEYDHSKKRYIICGASDNIEVMEAKIKFIEENPDAILIDEDAALKHRMDFSQVETYKYVNIRPPEVFVPEMEDLYGDVPKKLRGKRVDPVRDSKTDPKIGRNEFCSCGSGLKYKKCCLNKK